MCTHNFKKPCKKETNISRCYKMVAIKNCAGYTNFISDSILSKICWIKLRIISNWNSWQVANGQFFKLTTRQRRSRLWDNSAKGPPTLFTLGVLTGVAGKERFLMWASWFVNANYRHFYCIWPIFRLFHGPSHAKTRTLSCGFDSCRDLIRFALAILNWLLK